MPPTAPVSPAIPVAPVPDAAINPIGADVANIFNAVVTAVAGAMTGGPFDILEWVHVVSDVLWLAGDVVKKYGATPAGFKQVVAEFESLIQTNVVDVVFKGGGIASTISWVEKHLAAPQILAVVRDALSKHHIALISPVVPPLPPIPVPAPSPPAPVTKA